MGQGEAVLLVLSSYPDMESAHEVGRPGDDVLEFGLRNALIPVQISLLDDLNRAEEFDQINYCKSIITLSFINFKTNRTAEDAFTCLKIFTKCTHTFDNELHFLIAHLLPSQGVDHLTQILAAQKLVAIKIYKNADEMPYLLSLSMKIP
jgi:hypothetical protein